MAVIERLAQKRNRGYDYRRPYGSGKFCVLYSERGRNSHVTEEVPLLKRAKAYDLEALAELYDHYGPRMYAYIYRRVGDATLAEDLTAELFLRVLRALRNERAWSDSFRAWLYRVAHNLVVDHYRRQPSLPAQSLDESLAAQHGDPLVIAEDVQASERLRAAIGQLTQDQQQVLALRFGEGLTAKETARILGKSTGAVEALQHRALAALRRILTGEE
jgi:RNA polymerase sigma-70 factor (ECF subfamily)